MKNYKLTIPSTLTETQLWEFVEEQEIATVEDVVSVNGLAIITLHFEEATAELYQQFSEELENLVD